MAEADNKVTRIYPDRLPSGGGGNGGDSDMRITALEKAFDRIDGKLDGVTREVGDLRVQMATMVERVNHLPGKGFVVTALLLSLLAIGGLVTFQGHIARIVGVSSVTPPAASSQPTPD